MYNLFPFSQSYSIQVALILVQDESMHTNSIISWFYILLYTQVFFSPLSCTMPPSWVHGVFTSSQATMLSSRTKKSSLTSLAITWSMSTNIDGLLCHTSKPWRSTEKSTLKKIAMTQKRTMILREKEGVMEALGRTETVEESLLATRAKRRLRENHWILDQRELVWQVVGEEQVTNARWCNF